uniref:Candidate secreted effector n=1 Tax=Meloidogyne incognita TaxID=6306 RepID=A0A914L3X5_MELIC
MLTLFHGVCFTYKIFRTHCARLCGKFGLDCCSSIHGPFLLIRFFIGEGGGWGGGIQAPSGCFRQFRVEKGQIRND